MGSIPVPVTRKKIGTPQGVPIFFVVHGTTSNPAHKWHKLTIVLCVILFLSLVFRFVRVRLGSYTAIGGILRRASLFVIIDIRGTPFTYSSRAADSRTCLPLGVMFAATVPPDLSYDSHLLAGQYTAYAVCKGPGSESTSCDELPATLQLGKVHTRYSSKLTSVGRMTVSWCHCSKLPTATYPNFGEP